MSQYKNKNMKRKKDRVNNRLLLIIGLLVVLFFIASAYGVQRTILSSFAGENVPITKWFENFAWISIAFTLSGFGLFKALAGFFMGVSPRSVSNRAIIIAGAGSFCLGSIPLLLSEGNPLMIGLGNSFLGAGEGLLYAGAMIYLTDISTHARRAQMMGIMELSVYGGYSFGALAAGVIFLIADSYSASFIFSAVIALAGLILSFLSVKSVAVSGVQQELEKLRTPLAEEELTSSLRSIITKPTVLVTLVNGHISKMVDSIIVLFLPLILSVDLYGYGFSIQQAGLITAVFTLTWAISMPLTGRISDSIGRKRPIFLGLILEALAIFGIQWGASPFLILFMLSALAGIGVGLYYPILPSMAIDIAPEIMKPRFIGLYRAIKDLGYFTGPLIAGFFAQLWYDTGSDMEIVLHSPLMLASFVLLLGGMMILIVRETRPGWAQFQTSLQHAQLIEESVIQATKGLIVYLEQDAMDHSIYQSRLTRYTAQAKDLELQADDALEEIAIQTYQSLHKSPDASNFLRIARRIDRVAGLTLGALYRIQVIPIEDIPAIIQEKLHNASIALRSLVRTTVDVLQVLELRLEAVAGMYRVAREKETQLDLLYQMMNRQLFISAKEDMHYGTWYAIRDVISMIEQAADSAEDAAEVINILAIKYKT
jgi:MFS family permease